MRARVRNFGYAFRGIGLLLRNEHNAWIHLVASVLVFVLGFVCRISTMEWVAVVLCIGGVLAAEALNTAIEALCDHVTPERHPNIMRIKDLAAGAVLLLAIAAAVVGTIIFLPKLL